MRNIEEMSIENNNKLENTISDMTNNVKIEEQTKKKKNETNDEGLPRIPNLELSKLKFFLEKQVDDVEVQNKVLAIIRADSMAPYYRSLCEELKLPINQKLMEELEEENRTKIKELNKKIEDAKENFGEIEIRDAHIARCEYYAKIGDRDHFNDILKETIEKATSIEYRIDLAFLELRHLYFFNEMKNIGGKLEKLEEMIDNGGDWDKRNRFKVYRALYCMSVRDFKTAAVNFLATIATFTSYELMTYEEFVKYSILCSILALERPEFRKKVLKCSEILEVMNTSLKSLKLFAFSFYQGDYGDFFRSLAFHVELDLKNDIYLCRHSQYYVKEMRVKAYNQLLQSYQSLRLDYLAKVFGVSEKFIDMELSRFISCGRLHCKIDQVQRIVRSDRPDSKNHLYQETIKKGDLLLNRIQKLNRVINC
ncbi:hypothetical protein SNEBB_002918 [Seison nebaliae]|nr:hypothetical protein SNEBB_002918 [Seison nebaliae]